MTLPGIKEKGAANLLRGIEASKQRPLVNVLLALGIRHVGWETARLIAEHIGRLDGLLEVDAESLQGIDGIWAVVSGAVLNWVQQERSRALVERLVAHGINPVHETTQVAGGDARRFDAARHWAPETMSRTQAEDKIRELGGKVGSSVTKTTDFLVVGADAGTKLAKAEKLGVRTITEEEFGRLVEGGPGALESSSSA